MQVLATSFFLFLLDYSFGSVLFSFYSDVIPLSLAVLFHSFDCVTNCGAVM